MTAILRHISGEQKQRKDSAGLAVPPGITMNADTTLTLIHSARRGDVSAFGSLYEQHATGMYKFALWYLKDPDDAEDAVQNCVLSAFRNIASVKKPESFRSWLFQILANACKDILRDKQKRGDLSIEEADAPVFDDYEDGSFTRMLSALNDEERRIVTLSVLGGFNSREISRLMKINENTVRSKLSRSLKKIRDRYENDR